MMTSHDHSIPLSSSSRSSSSSLLTSLCQCDLCDTFITGCARSTVVTATPLFYRKTEILTPCKIRNLEQIDAQFVKIDYVDERNVCFKFVENLFWANAWVKYNILSCDIFFSEQHREQTPRRILTLNGLKDVQSCKNVPCCG